MTRFSRLCMGLMILLLCSSPAAAGCDEPELPECMDYLKFASAEYANSCRNKLKSYLIQLDEWVSCSDDPGAFDKASEKVNEISIKIFESIGI